MERDTSGSSRRWSKTLVEAYVHVCPSLVEPMWTLYVPVVEPYQCVCPTCGTHVESICPTCGNLCPCMSMYVHVCPSIIYVCQAP